MGSRDKETAHHPPLLSSLVVRPSDDAEGGGGAQSDYEPGEVRPYSRSHNSGYRVRAGSGSPLRHRNSDNHYSSNFERTSNMPRNRGFGSGRGPGRYRDNSPPHFRGRGGGRPFGRGFDGPGLGGPFRGENISRNNPNVRPREGDWYCSDHACGNLNFARREQCNNCHRPRYGPVGSPRRGYPARVPPPIRRFQGPPMDRSPRKGANGYRSPPRGWARDGPREFGISDPPHARHEGRFGDHMRRERPDFLEDDYSGRRPMPPPDLPPRERGRDMLINDRIGYERRLPSPPLAPLATPSLPPSRWARERSRSPIRGGPPPPKDWARERSRSPIRGGPPPPKDYRRDAYLDRGRDERRDVMRDRVADAY